MLIHVSLLILIMQIQNKINNLFLVFFLLVFLFSCKEAYWPELDKYENVLVVDGLITNEPGPYTIRLSFSSPIDSAQFIPYTNCQLIILDNSGNSETLTEWDPGIYMTSEMGIQGTIGRKYKLEIHTPDSKTYESSYKELKAPVGINSVYAEIEYHRDEHYDYELVGYQFYLDTELAEQDSNFYLWRADATYQYQSDFTIRWYYDGQLKWFHGPDSLYNCWSTYRVGKIFTQSTQSMSTPKIDRYALHYVNTQSRQLSVRYSLLTKQYTIDKEAYEFWSGVGEQNADQESLYTLQPYQISSNVKNIENENDPVLGYFLVAGAAEKRIFVDRPLYPIPLRYSVCEVGEGDFHAYGQLAMADPVFYPIYAIETNGGRRAVPNQSCVDCRLKGGTITKPDFWID